MSDTEILKRMHSLELRVTELERAKPRVYGPIEAAPAYEPLEPAPHWHGSRVLPHTVTITSSRCGKCGIHLSPVMSYTCAQADCPTGLGGASCMSAATLAKVYGHGGPFGEDGALLAQGYAENQ